MKEDFSQKASLRRLKFCNFKLDSLLEITQAINQNESTEQLLNKYENLLRKELNIGKVLLFQFNKVWEIILESGFISHTFDNIDVEKDLLNHEDISTTSSSMNSLIQAFDIIIPVFHNKKPLAYVLIGDIDEEKDGISPTIKHLRFIQTLTNIIIVAIENKRLYRGNLRQEAIRKELELASKMQEMLVPDPKTFPHNEKLSIHAFYYPHFKIGGDYYDHIKLNDNEFGFCIADVSGKGISAALLMSNFQASLRALFTAKIPLDELINKLNQVVIQNTQGDKFITMFLGKYNYKTRILKYVNAGHNPPTLYKSQTGNYTNLEWGCPGIGMLEEIPQVIVSEIMIPSKTKLLCYTDGVVEIEDDNKKEIGLETIQSFIKHDEPIDKIIQQLINKLGITQGNKSVFDDITILGIEFY